MTANFHKKPEFETIQLHSGQTPDRATNARAVPIYASTSFNFNNYEHMQDIFNMNKEGNIYSRLANPTTAVFERRMAELEGGLAAIAVASGQSALFLAIAALAQAGDNVVASSYLFAGTFVQLKSTIKGFGISIKFVSDPSPSAFAAAIDEHTKAIYIESIANPRYLVPDIPVLAKIAHDNQIPLIVDNTFGMGGFLVRPFDLGADIIVESATKWICGHGTTVGGVIIDSGKFPWFTAPKFHKLFNEPSEVTGFKWSQLGEQAFITRLRMEFATELGPCLSPFAAFLLLQGLETLSLRCERHCDNALALARYLENHPKVAWVSYAGLESHESHAMAKKLFRKGYFGSMLSIGLKDSKETVAKFVDGLRLTSHLVNLGDAKTLIIHPAAAMNFRMGEEDNKIMGVSDDLLRVSVGIEHISDIIADFEGALGRILLLL